MNETAMTSGSAGPVSLFAYVVVNKGPAAKGLRGNPAFEEPNGWGRQCRTRAGTRGTASAADFILAAAVDLSLGAAGKTGETNSEG